MVVCLARSSAFSMGDAILDTVKNAAKFAVYDEIMINVKNHQMEASVRVDSARGAKSLPCCMIDPKLNHKQFPKIILKFVNKSF